MKLSHNNFVNNLHCFILLLQSTNSRPLIKNAINIFSKSIKLHRLSKQINVIKHPYHFLLLRPILLKYWKIGFSIPSTGTKFLKKNNNKRFILPQDVRYSYDPGRSMGNTLKWIIHTRYFVRKNQGFERTLTTSVTRNALGNHGIIVWFYSQNIMHWEFRKIQPHDLDKLLSIINIHPQANNEIYWNKNHHLYCKIFSKGKFLIRLLSQSYNIIIGIHEKYTYESDTSTGRIKNINHNILSYLSTIIDNNPDFSHIRKEFRHDPLWRTSRTNNNK